MSSHSGSNSPAGFLPFPCHDFLFGQHTTRLPTKFTIPKPKNHQIYHSIYQKHQTNHAKHQANHPKYKIHHLLFTLSGQHTASPPRGQHPNPPSSSWKDIRWEETKDWSVYKYQQQTNIRFLRWLISVRPFWKRNQMQQLRKGVYTNWTAGLRVVAGVLRVWTGFPVGIKIKSIGTEWCSKKYQASNTGSQTYNNRWDKNDRPGDDGTLRSV